MDAIFAAYVVNRIGDIKIELKLLSSGFLRTTEHYGNGATLDITAETLLSYRAELAELESLKTQMEIAERV